MNRRSVLNAFGQYLDYAEWMARVKAGKEEPAEGDTLSDMARDVVSLELRYKKAVTDYIDKRVKEL